MKNELQNLTTPGDILEFALAQEKEAYRIYSALLGQSRAEILRELIEQLKDEEHRHIRLIERKITELDLGH